MEWTVALAGGFAVLVAVWVIQRLDDVHVCAGTGRTARLTKLLAADRTLLQKRNGAGELPIHHAAKFGAIAALELLLDAGSDINATTPDGATPLHMAAAFGEVAAVRALLRRGGDIHAFDAWGLTPVMAAQPKGHTEVIKELGLAAVERSGSPLMIDFGLGWFPSPVAASDPLVAAAITRARATAASLRAHGSDPNDRVAVLVPLLTDAGITEHVWGEVVGLDDERMKLRPLSLPLSQNADFPPELDRRVEEFEDWLVLRSDGSVTGGFTIHLVFFRIAERFGGLPEGWSGIRRRFVDYDETMWLTSASQTTP